MGEDWKPGDLALCIREGFCPIRRVDMAVRKGGVYIVTIAKIVKDDFGRDEMALGFSHLPKGKGLNARWFRRVDPHNEDADDRETIRLLTQVPETVDA